MMFKSLQVFIKSPQKDVSVHTHRQAESKMFMKNQKKKTI